MLFGATVLFHFFSLTLVVAAIKIMAACVNDRDDAPLGPEWHQLAGGGNAMCPAGNQEFSTNAAPARDQRCSAPSKIFVALSDTA